MASLAAERRSVRAFSRHPVVELALVGILVARGASPVLKFERQNFVRAAGCTEFVAVDASNRRMCAGQGKARGSMLGDGKRGAMKIDDRVAAFALVAIGCGGELSVMGVLVAIAARPKLYFVNRVLAGRNVALRALHLDVFALQWITRIVVFFHSKEGGFPAIQVVAFRALAFLWASLKLALVGIRLVAIVAVRECELFLEVAVHVARHAGNLGVLAGQGIFRFRVVEIISREHRLPAAGAVAGIAGFLEFAFVRIDVAIGTGGKFHVAIAPGPSRRIRLMTLFASHSCVKSCE